MRSTGTHPYIRTAARSAWARLATARNGRVLILFVALTLFTSARPNYWPSSQPLPWDMSHHYLGALRVAHAAGDLSISGIWNELRQADLYPPGHSLVYGLWFAVTGSDPSAWWMLDLLFYLATTFLIARISPLGALCFLALALHGALAPTLMVEPLANLFLIATLVAFRRAVQSDGSRWPIFCGLLAGATLLTKYNVGLPLLVALPAAGYLCRRREGLLRALPATAIAAAALLLYLGVQHDGWDMFLRFAENRENTAALNPAERAVRYAALYDRFHFDLPAAAIIIVLVSIMGGAGRAPAALAALCYALFAMAAFSLHPYVIPRNLVAPAATLALAFGIGAERLARSRSAGLVRWGLAAGLLFITLYSLPLRKAEALRHYPVPDEGLGQLSVRMETVLRSERSVRIFGSFNRFSPGWIRILAARVESKAALSFNLDYPLQAPRSSLPSHWDQAYVRQIDAWAPDGEEVVLVIAIAEDSPLRSYDYELWSEWQLNYMRALRANHRYDLAAEEQFASGLSLLRFERTRIAGVRR